MDIRFEAPSTREIIENHGLAEGGRVKKFIVDMFMVRILRYPHQLRSPAPEHTAQYISD